ncbi:amidophosphoribosyltransferase [Tieghemostelium lacteum]|uniref:Amidophosphoribosyltransferase n=1 Tax=Tieghemostelium lacteum TaxID=361077 RepID=A0A151ZFE9_TIELA|nr:amidophosphoribosyltransferase [Tieghemostelium lacteum]|eukprot:KYQ92657.1 amidophosphoribosyltransferase [Tieghemostelium lacteum]
MNENVNINNNNVVEEIEDVDSKPKEYCGVFGIYAPELDVSRIAFFALVALQHRGQESCGIATYDEFHSVHVETGMGLVNQVFNEANLKPLRGHMAIGHTRYSTAGKSTINNAQPVIVQTLHGQIGIAQNGNLTTAKSLRKELLEKGVGFFKDSDVEIITQLLSNNPTNQIDNSKPNWESRISYFMSKAEGAYSLCLMTPNGIYGVRDFLGMRPLCIGSIEVPSLENPEKMVTRYVIASESCAINTIGGKYVREVRPGEIVHINESGITSFIGREPSKQSALCIFEYVYFSRPDSVMEGQLIHSVRQRMGEQLARESPIPAPKPNCPLETIVIGVPDSSLPAAIGYSKQSGYPYTEGLTKNRYIHRTFIQPTDHLRQQGIKLKFNPLTENIQGKRVILIDDSIVRGNTIKALIKLIRSAGAVEVHVRISSPPVLHPCYMGIDMATYEQLTGHQKTVDEICKLIGADTLQYLSLEGMNKCVQVGKPPIQLQLESNNNSKPTECTKVDNNDTTTTNNSSSNGYCNACFNGNYPLSLDF